jgi:hypothetical protein
MSATFEESLRWVPLEPIAPSLGPSPYELSVDPLAVDARRPWPLGVPLGREVLEAISDGASVARGLKRAHLNVSRLLPEQLRDAVAAALRGTGNPLASVSISVWRALVAAECLEDAFGVDQPALRALIDEAAGARERLVALGCFSLDGGASAEPLLQALGAAIELLVKRAQFVAKPRVRRATTGASGKARLVRSTSRALNVACAASMLFAAVFHLNGALEERRARHAWVVVGDVDRGRAFLAPGGTDPDEAALQALIEQLQTQGIAATKSASGEWVLHRSGKATP